MKLLNQITFLVILTILVSCEKDQDDFRDQYVGRYQVKETISSYGIYDYNPYSRTRDTVIRVDYGNTDTTLLLLGREIWLNDEGYFNDYHYGCRLWNDSLSSYYMNGGLGGGQYESYVGFRVGK